ncbi:MAG: 16S rRNA (cytosine(1402)-N(4))-methyltransferase RsmH [Clostridia bacterium]|nr:16S rRNA (cytosine(1402)-N(4))-methyltransferase RsmH [Clostridia bacterium]
MEFVHKPVLFDEAIDALNIKSNGIYLDGTAGGGGHSGEIASKLDTGRLISVDQDPDAISVLTEKFSKNDRVTVVHSNFDNIDSMLDSLGIDKIDGMLLDLGVSSYQLDTAERGFSFHNDAPLDMRMSKQGATAADLVNTLDEASLAKILWDYGEERYSRRIASAIVKCRQSKAIETTLELVEIIKSAIPAAARREGGHPARRSFQALRIAVNDELGRLRVTLDAAFNRLNVGGRLVIISFHSLEDRIVKQKFADFCKGCTCPADFPICVCGNKQIAFMPFKSKAPTEKELELNPRSRSARVRAVERKR